MITPPMEPFPSGERVQMHGAPSISQRISFALGIFDGNSHLVKKCRSWATQCMPAP